jgi:hypothetical protein
LDFIIGAAVGKPGDRQEKNAQRLLYFRTLSGRINFVNASAKQEKATDAP